MTPALGRANQKLHHASILLRLVRNERQREDIPLRHLLDATVPATLAHLRAAYGWFLLELANPGELPSQPPASVTEVVEGCRLEEPLRGELVELKHLERTGWLHDLIAETGESARSAAVATGAGGAISLVQQDWDEPRLRDCHDKLAEIIDRMSHSLEEW